MNLTLECPGCKNPTRAAIESEQRSVRCTGCNREIALRTRSAAGPIHECAVCGTDELYVQKDFPHQVGLAIVGLGIVLSSIAWFNYKYPFALAILLVTAALDLCLYYLVGDVLVCYRCLAQYRGVPRGEQHKPFDLAIGERYRQERIRLEMLRRETSVPGKPDGPN